MADAFAPTPINPLVSITPLTTQPAGRDAMQVPPQLANLSPGTLLEGFVVNRDGQSNPILRTPTLGDVLVKSDVFIKTGSEVVFRVDPSQPGAARIVSIDGMPPQDYAAALKARVLQTDTISPSTTSPAAAPLTGAANAATGTAPRTSLPPLQAILLNSASLQPAAAGMQTAIPVAMATAIPIPTSLQKLAPGTPLTARLLEVTLPNAPTNSVATPAASPVGVPPSAPPAVVPAATAGTLPPPPATDQGRAVPTSLIFPPTPEQGTQARPAQHVPLHTINPPAPTAIPLPPASVGSAIAGTPAAPSMSITANIPAAPVGTPQPTSPAPMAPFAPATPLPTAVAPPATGIPAQIIGHEKDGASILQSPVGTLKIHLPQPLPVGTTVTLALDVVANLGTPVPAPTGGVEQITALAQHWPALMEAAATADPTLLRDLTQAIPTIGHKLTSGMLFFIAAVKGGELKQWIGTRATSALELKSPDLAARLKGDMLQLQQMMLDSPLQQWNSVMVPLLHEGVLEQARLFFRQDTASDDPSHSKQQKEGREQRFIVEVDLSHIGEVQFDGFVRPGEKAKQFDLIVRSHMALPGELAQKIRETFENAMGSTGMKGYLGFQHGQQHFVRPMAGQAPGQSGSQPILA